MLVLTERQVELLRLVGAYALGVAIGAVLWFIEDPYSSLFRALVAAGIILGGGVLAAFGIDWLRRRRLKA